MESENPEDKLWEETMSQKREREKERKEDLKRERTNPGETACNLSSIL